jgi:hypothetical protein
MPLVKVRTWEIHVKFLVLLDAKHRRKKENRLFTVATVATLPSSNASDLTNLASSDSLLELLLFEVRTDD